MTKYKKYQIGYLYQIIEKHEDIELSWSQKVLIDTLIRNKNNSLMIEFGINNENRLRSYFEEILLERKQFLIKEHLKKIKKLEEQNEVV